MLLMFIFHSNTPRTRSIWSANGKNNSPVYHSARHQRPARERHRIRTASRENVDNQTPRNHISTFQFTFKCEYNDFISKYTTLTVYM